MRRALAIACAAALALAAPAAAQNLPQTVKITGGYLSLGYCQLTSTQLTAAALLSADLASAGCNAIPTCGNNEPCVILAEFCTESVALRYRDDGVAPSSTVGMPINASTCFQYAGPFSTMQLIQQASSGILDLTFYK
jgi:hypothetical protein